jgi:hypothetical protein
MSPMRSIGWIDCGKNICRGSPFPGRLLTLEHKAGGVGTSEPGDISCKILAATSLRIGDRLYYVSELIDLDGLGSVILPPSLEKLGDALALRISDLKGFDPLHRVLTSQRKKRIATPLCPGLEAAKRLAAGKV